MNVSKRLTTFIKKNECLASNEVDFVTRVYQKGTLLRNAQKLTLSANTLDVEEVTAP